MTDLKTFPEQHVKLRTKILAYKSDSSSEEEFDEENVPQYARNKIIILDRIEESKSISSVFDLFLLHFINNKRKAVGADFKNFIKQILEDHKLKTESREFADLRTEVLDKIYDFFERKKVFKLLFLNVSRKKFIIL